jgi:hypothetical protein
MTIKETFDRIERKYMLEDGSRLFTVTIVASENGNGVKWCAYVEHGTESLIGYGIGWTEAKALKEAKEKVKAAVANWTAKVAASQYL